MYKVIGKQHKVGEYEGKTYDNYVFHCSYKDESIEGVGVFTIKIKAINYGGDVNIGDTVLPYYDQYRNCIALIKP